MLLFLFILSIQIQAQTSNVILFTENGEKFTVILNGLRQNAKPETNVKIQDLNAPQYKMKIIFDDIKLGESSFNLFLEPGKERTFSVSKNKKGNYTLRLISDVAITNSSPVPSSQSVYNYNNTGTPVPVYDPAGSVNINMNMGENGGGINMTTPEGNINMSINTNMPNGNGAMTGNEVITNPVPGYAGPYGCPYPMSASEFSALKGSVASKSFEDSKLTIAKQGINTNCLTALQIKELLSVFTFEETKLDFAKYAYNRAYDVNNYYKINDVFTFESSIEELNEYINANRK